MVKANGTIAKDIAIHFLNQTQERYTSAMVGKTIVQAKRMLEAGYTKQEIMDSIDYVVDKTSVQMYSLGYIETAINSILEKIELDKKQKEIDEKIKQMKREYVTKRDEVKHDKSTERNKSKLDGFGLKPRFGEEFTIDMPEEQREDN